MIKNKIIFITGLLLISSALLATVQVRAVSPASDLVYEPTSELLNLDQAGSLASPVILNLSLDFDLVSHFIISLSYTSTQYITGQFASAPALTNGLLIKYNNKNLIDNVTIKSNSNLDTYADSFTKDFDDASPHNIHLTSEFIYLDLHELIITTTATLQFYIQDDITAITSINEFVVLVKGYTLSNNPTGIDSVIQQVNSLTGQNPGDSFQTIITELLPVAGYILLNGLLLITLWKVLTYES